jgi:hypothetical protein
MRRRFVGDSIDGPGGRLGSLYIERIERRRLRHIDEKSVMGVVKWLRVARAWWEFCGGMSSAVHEGTEYGSVDWALYVVARGGFR